jgi:hypothetical protein
MSPNTLQITSLVTFRKFLKNSNNAPTYSKLSENCWKPFALSKQLVLTDRTLWWTKLYYFHMNGFQFFNWLMQCITSILNISNNLWNWTWKIILSICRLDVNECSRKGLCKTPEVCVNKIKTGYECQCAKEFVRDKASKKCVGK